ncbi:MAG: DUF1566 domain-containing protein [Candidatus Omnitrophota bacterium]
MKTLFLAVFLLLAGSLSFADTDSVTLRTIVSKTVTIKGVPKTGQAGYVYYNGDDGTYNKGYPPSGEEFFYNSANGILYDNATGLMWAVGNQAKGYTWPNAITFCESCKAGGFEDWRLPNIKELLTLVNYGHQLYGNNWAGYAYGETTVIDRFFTASSIPWQLFSYDTSSGYEPNYRYWSSTTAKKLTTKKSKLETNHAFCVNFGSGRTQHREKKYTYTGTSKDVVYNCAIPVRGPD